MNAQQLSIIFKAMWIGRRDPVIVASQPSRACMHALGIVQCRVEAVNVLYIE
jgi:hypothetical protein